jgi:micrococcal nuclease
MKKYVLPFLFLFGLIAGFYSKNGNILIETEKNRFALAPDTQTDKTAIPANEQYAVLRIIDGDTIVVKINGKEERVRLIGLDTPETVDPRKIVECFGKEASEEAKRILAENSVRLETDPSQNIRDKYGRLLAYVFLNDGTNFNKMMIENGYGYEYAYDVPYKYQKEFQSAEKSAKANKKGLWKEGACL